MLGARSSRDRHGETLLVPATDISVLQMRSQSFGISTPTRVEPRYIHPGDVADEHSVIWIEYSRSMVLLWFSLCFSCESTVPFGLMATGHSHTDDHFL